jgi:hypothetical protein
MVNELWRILLRVQPNDESGCWIWKGKRDRDGYGQMRLYPPYLGRTMQVHRYVYEQLKGPIPEGLVTDHLCRVTSCCNPEHLEIVTRRINTLRGDTLNAMNAAKTRCVNGHEFTAENTYSDGRRRACKTCRRAIDRRRYAKKVGGWKR